MIIKTTCLRIKSHYNHKKDLKVNHVVYILKKSIRLHEVVMMIEDYKLLTELQHIHMEQMLVLWRFWIWKNNCIIKFNK